MGTMTQRDLYAAVKALPHMTITRTEDGEYRVAYTMATIQAAKPEWGRTRCETHQERTSYYTDDREDALGSAKSLSAHMVGLLARVAANECSPCRWSELTEYEKAEATSRGFPREAGVRYVTKIKYDMGRRELSLVRWFRLAGED
ncbi:hypothetical protein [Sphingobium sp. CCH11-B1]|uniref:hypothetical protein n=1 Tax=Sphingobium sp. CCH11-B1 TaxID=1768781 RepID=UPI00083086DA|nr:hypothetical protein [Sphingobium sp. CCH11-B1]